MGSAAPKYIFLQLSLCLAQFQAKTQGLEALLQKMQAILQSVEWKRNQS